MYIISSMDFFATDVFREGNACVDSLANLGLTLDHLKIWLDAPDSIKSSLTRNKTGIPKYRFVTFEGGFGFVCPPPCACFFVFAFVYIFWYSLALC